MDDKDKQLKKAKRSAEEFEMAWQEFFKNKPRPKNDEEERKEQEEFHNWYNHIRKQSDTGKTPAEMYKEIYGKEPPKNPTEESRMMNFEWDEDYNEDYDEDFDNLDEEERLNELTKIADHIFDNGVWSNSKEQMKDMSKRDSSRHMFRLGVFIHSQYMHEQMKEITEELKTMSKEDVQKMVDNFRERKEDRKDE